MFNETGQENLQTDLHFLYTWSNVHLLQLHIYIQYCLEHYLAFLVRNNYRANPFKFFFYFCVLGVISKEYFVSNVNDLGQEELDGAQQNVLFGVVKLSSRVSPLIPPGIYAITLLQPGHPFHFLQIVTVAVNGCRENFKRKKLLIFHTNE